MTWEIKDVEGDEYTVGVCYRDQPSTVILSQKRIKTGDYAGGICQHGHLCNDKFHRSNAGKSGDYSGKCSAFVQLDSGSTCTGPKEGIILLRETF